MSTRLLTASSRRLGQHLRRRYHRLGAYFAEAPSSVPRTLGRIQALELPLGLNWAILEDRAFYDGCAQALDEAQTDGIFYKRLFLTCWRLPASAVAAAATAAVGQAAFSQLTTGKRLRLRLGIMWRHMTSVNQKADPKMRGGREGAKGRTHRQWC